MQGDWRIYRTTSEDGSDACAKAVVSVFGKGKGARFSSTDTEEYPFDFTWSGNVLVTRPEGQTSLVPDIIPDQLGGFYLVSGAISYRNEDADNTFIITAVSGKVRNLCTELAPGSDP